MAKFYISIATINIRISVILILLTLIPKNVGDDIEINSDCKYKPCESKPHTMCKYPEELDKDKKTCKGPESKGGLTQEQRRGLLDRHNEMRQMIAQGKVRGQPKAANMMKMRWNFELEEIAQRYLNSCPETTGHDTCRKMLDGTSVGQNSAWGPFKYKQFPDNKDLGEKVVKIWFDEVKDMKPYHVDDITNSGDQFKDIGHYTQLVWANSEELGCGYIAHEYEDAVYQYYTCNCNYAPSGNVFNPPSEVYKTGEPCSQCPENTWCSKRFPGLCTAEEDEYDDIRNTSSTTEGPRKKKRRRHRKSAGGSVQPNVRNLVFAVVCVATKYFVS